MHHSTHSFIISLQHKAYKIIYYMLQIIIPTVKIHLSMQVFQKQIIKTQSIK